jgi:Tol biopolymer transport system component
LALTPGTRLGVYEVTAQIGAGGMGEVYRATDSSLKRSVAIKVLPASVAGDADRLTRFQREAEVLAALNHPNIAAIYGLEKTPDFTALVIELVEGDDLSQRIAHGAIPLDEALPIAKQIAEALEAAHEQGIIHRDLKPANIKVRTDGTVKVLDFGLAKAIDATGSSDADAMNSPTLSMLPTQAGLILGTAAYMSPEQAKGRAVDKRADIWAFGAVLYEMLTGRRAFTGDGISDILAAVLRQDIEWTALPAATPQRLRRVIERCLDRDVKQRLRDIGEARVEIAKLEAGAPDTPREAATSVDASRLRRAWITAGALGLALVASLLAVAIAWRTPKPAARAMFFSVPFQAEVRDLTVGPDGHTVAVVGYSESARKNAIWLYDVGSQASNRLANTEGANFPFWSADGRSLGFFADGKLKTLDVAGGQVQTLCDAPAGRGGTWNKDGVIIFTPSGQLFQGLYRVAASGGAPTQVSTPDKHSGESSHRWPTFLPDGKHYLYLADSLSGNTGADGIYMGALDSNEKRFVVNTPGNAAYAAGYLVFMRDKTLLAQPFDVNTGALTRDPVAVFTQVQYLPKIERVVFAVSGTGPLFAQQSGEASLSRLAWFDRTGKEVGAVGNPAVYANVSLAPDGQSVAVDRTDEGSQNTDVWTYAVRQDRAKRLTFDPALDAMPVWSPDGSRVIFASSRKNMFDVYLKNVDGTHEEQVVAHGDADEFPTDWSRDGKYVLYEKGQELWSLTFPELKSSLFLKGPSTVKNGQFSPDGKWVAYASNESGKWDIYVTSFPEGRGKWQVSNGGGEQPRWKGDGKELFYLSPDGRIMAVPISAGVSVDAGSPTALFQANPREAVATSERILYDVDRNGQRFLINTQVKKTESQSLSVVLNWDAPFRK